MYQRPLPVLALSVALAFSLACSGGDTAVCTPGATQRCVCPVGEGAQSCNADGTAWLACVCGDTDAGVVDAPPGDAAAPDDAPLETDADACTSGAITATIADLTTGAVGVGTRVILTDVVAMSPVFLVSLSRTTGACLWGAFVSAPGLTETTGNSGLLVTSYGTMAEIPPGGASAVCPVPGTTPNGSAIPDDVAPGDVVTVVGTLARVLLPTCTGMSGAAEVGQLEIASACAFDVHGSGPVPAPHVLTAPELAALASPTDALAHDAWGGVLVRAEGVSAAVPAMPATCATGSSSVGTFGEITLAGSGITVVDRVYYQGALAAVDRCHAVPVYCRPSGTVSFTSIEGFHYLDFCTWGMAPMDRCGGLAPASDDCSVASCLP